MTPDQVASLVERGHDGTGIWRLVSKNLARVPEPGQLDILTQLQALHDTAARTLTPKVRTQRIEALGDKLKELAQ